MQERNDLGLQLIERNEEVCVFYERQNVSESLLRKAGMELSAREEELRFLRMEVREGGERREGEGKEGAHAAIVCTWKASDKGCVHTLTLILALQAAE